MDSVVLFLVTVLFGILLTMFYENRIVYGRFKGKLLYIKGHHVHHSNVGLVLLFAALLLVINDHYATSRVISGLGVGLIIQHTLSEKKFVFVSKKH